MQTKTTLKLYKVADINDITMQKSVNISYYHAIMHMTMTEKD